MSLNLEKRPKNLLSNPDKRPKRQTMLRVIDYFLQEWKQSPIRKSLLLRGGRQVGKTHAIRKLGESYENYVEINLEEQTELHSIFEKNLDPSRILHEIGLHLEQHIQPQNTLLFIDEIQAVPRAVIALRYFYEKMPELHVVGAGSLLEFAIEKVGVPVGRVSFLYLTPVTFFEFLLVSGRALLAKAILDYSDTNSFSDVAHSKAMEALAEYLSIGGMPEVVQSWVTHKNLFACQRILEDLNQSYILDFPKYARSSQVKYVDLIFRQSANHLGNKFTYQGLESSYRKRELEPALELLCQSGIIKKVFHTAGNGTPLSAEVSLKHFKIIGMDIGLTQLLLGAKTQSWMLQFESACVNKGDIIEAFVGQELLGYACPDSPGRLYYWMNEKRGSMAEVDYVISQDSKVVPIEVKSGSHRQLKSLHQFLEKHPHSSYGIHVAPHSFGGSPHLKKLPLYALCRLVDEPRQREVLSRMLEDVLSQSVL